MMQTSGYFEQILATASRTSSCDSVKPDVSMRRWDTDLEKHRL